MHWNKKKLQAVIPASVAGMLLAYLLAPGWWLSAPVTLYKKWYPLGGSVLYVAVHYLLQLLFTAGLAVLVYLNRHGLIYLVKAVYAGVKAVYHLLKENVAPYLLHNALPERRFVSTLFFRGLGFVYFFAFVSLIYQIELVTENGLIPYKQFAALTLQHEGWSAFFTYPSVFWLSQSNWFIQLILYAGAAVSVLSMVCKVRGINFFLLWSFYLSAVNFGRDMFNFPWDLFLMEIAFLGAITACFVQRNHLPRVLLFALLLLFFRQWFTMGVVKAVWGGAPWYDLSFMKHYWLNQPSPTPFAMYAFQLPVIVQQTLTASALVLEMLIPVVMLFGRRPRIAAFFMSLALSVFIELYGNFSYFNVITAVLGLWCLDDRFFNKIQKPVSFRPGKFFGFIRPVFYALTAIVIAVNLLYIVLLFNKERNTYPMHIVNYYFSNSSAEGKSLLGKAVFETGKAISRFRIVSPQGVFQTITRERKQVQLQAKINGIYYPLTFKKWYDITDFHFVAPFMNYLPYKFYQWSHYVEFSLFLTIHPNTAYLKNSWKANLIKGIFENNPDIAKLISAPQKGKVEQIRIYRYRMHYHNNPPVFSISSPQNVILDSVYINPADTIDLSVFDNVKQHAQYLNKYK